MNTISEYIYEYKEQKFFDNIDTQLMCEKLKEPHLIELANFLKVTSKGANRDWQKESIKFKQMFRSCNVEWDKIKESDFQKFNGGDKEGIKLAKACRKDGNNFKDLLILYFNDKDEISAFANVYGLTLLYRGRYTDEYNYETKEYVKKQKLPDHYDNLKQKEIAEECEKCDKFWILDLRKFSVSAKQYDRRNAKDGMITPARYEQIARDNISRYKEIIAKHKAEKMAANDTISKEVKDILNEVMDIATKIMQGGAAYIDCDWELQGLLRDCYGEKQYNKGQTIGSDGLLVLYKRYVEKNIDSLKGLIYSGSGNEKVIAEIKEKINNIKSKIKRLQTKL